MLDDMLKTIRRQSVNVNGSQVTESDTPRGEQEHSDIWPRHAEVARNNAYKCILHQSHALPAGLRLVKKPNGSPSDRQRIAIL